MHANMKNYDDFYSIILLVKYIFEMKQDGRGEFSIIIPETKCGDRTKTNFAEVNGSGFFATSKRWNLILCVVI